MIHNDPTSNDPTLTALTRVICVCVCASCVSLVPNVFVVGQREVKPCFLLPKNNYTHTAWFQKKDDPLPILRSWSLSRPRPSSHDKPDKINHERFGSSATKPPPRRISNSQVGGCQHLCSNPLSQSSGFLFFFPKAVSTQKPGEFGLFSLVQLERFAAMKLYNINDGCTLVVVIL